MGCSASRGVNTLDSKYDNFHEDTNFIYASPISKSFSSSASPLSSIPIKRALSLQTPLVHHPPSRKGDSHHLVSLTSTTYGSLYLINEPKNPKFDNPKSPPKSTNKSPDEIMNLSPDSVINTWELMDGLDDNDDSSSFDFQKGQSLDPINIKSSSFHLMGIQDIQDSFKEIEEDKEIVMDKPSNSVSKSNTKPLWKHLSEELFLSNMDPNVVSSYRRALSSRHLGNSNKATLTSRRTETMPRSVGSSPMSNYYSTTYQVGFFSRNDSNNDCNKDEKVVLYFTSLRGIRKTYEDCCSVNMIFKGFRVPVDEKDISMDSSYRKELQNLLKGKSISLPQVFIRGRHIGGVEEIRQLNESGELVKLLEGFPVRDPKMVCDNCGDARFLPCSNCNGSRKVFDIEQEQLKRCLNCNENGLIRCPCCL